MLNPFTIGDQKVYDIVVQPEDIAQFPAGGVIHNVYRHVCNYAGC